MGVQQTYGKILSEVLSLALPYRFGLARRQVRAALVCEWGSPEKIALEMSTSQGFSEWQILGTK